MAACGECGFDWDTGEAGIIEVLDGVPPRFATMLAGLSEEALRQRPSPAVWSLLEYTAHTRDAIDWYRERIELVIGQHGSRLTPFDWDAACLERRYNEEVPEETTAQMEKSAAALANRLRGLPAEAWASSGIGSDGGERSVLVLARRASHEARHHLHDVTGIASRQSRFGQDQNSSKR